MCEGLEERGDAGAEVRAKIGLSSYLSEQNKEMPEYRLGHDDTMTLVAGYDVMLRRGATVSEAAITTGLSKSFLYSIRSKVKALQGGRGEGARARDGTARRGP